MELIMFGEIDCAEFMQECIKQLPEKYQKLTTPIFVFDNYHCVDSAEIFIKVLGGMGGQFIPEMNIINLYAIKYENPRDLLRAMFHEIRHAYQLKYYKERVLKAKKHYYIPKHLNRFTAWLNHIQWVERDAIRFSNQCMECIE